MKFNLKNYENKTVVMHCETEEEAKSFCEHLCRLGKSWCDGTSYIKDTYWNDFKKNTCYRFNEGTYQDKDYFERMGYTILEWSNFIKDTSIPFSKSDLRNKDVVLRRNGSVEIVNDDVLIAQEGWNDFDDIADDLTCIPNEGLRILE